MKLIALIPLALTACANTPQTEYDRRLACLAKMEVFEAGAKGTGRATPEWQRVATVMKGRVAQGLIETGKVLGKNDAAMDADLMTAVAETSQPFLKGGDNVEKDFAQLGEDVMACAKTYNPEKS